MRILRLVHKISRREVVLPYGSSLGWIDRSSDTTTTSYKPKPQARYLVDKMSESEAKLVDAVTRLSEKMESYDKQIMTLGSDMSKLQSQVDLSM
jgi:predicted  nucleic acid-binding Zn-ribbon protein